ncbi:Hypothetical protein, putative [Bodo saltans]|uniref:C3H1-type domain-containing protein n=1 Tax=Bodo saltans TaxID=75058 RepID=A0A0S4IXG8_BODSA|nr:Hypothetical protein, putative [Bodo saltans]|eukprot:CUF92494.1 Hypothetical protein, putative [Bodo saltans]
MKNPTTNTAPSAAPGLSAKTSSPQRGEGTERTRPRGDTNHNHTRQRSDWTQQHQSVSSNVTTNDDDDRDPQARSGLSTTMLSSSSPHASHEAAQMSSSNSINNENEKLLMSASYSHNPYTSPTTKYSPSTTSQPAPEAVGGVTVVLNYAPRHLRHRNPIFQEPVPPPPPPVASIDVPPTFRLDALPSPTTVPVQSPPQRPMCCYFKQKGFCKMGATCWYSHEGDLYTPCHYGASCKAGQATLVLMREKSDAKNLQHHSIE